MDTAIDLLSQFTGTGGGAKHALVNFGVAAIFWALLLSMAFTAPGRRNDPVSRPMTIGFALALARELLMLTVKVIEAYALISPEKLHLVFPPLEHALSNLGLAFIAGAYAARLTGDHAIWTRFTQAFVGFLVAVYATTSVWWFQFSWRNPEIRFGQTWTDWAFRITTSLLLVIAVVGILRGRRSRTRGIIVVAFSMFFLNEFLKIIDMAYGEQYEATFAVIRHTLFLGALPLLAYAYIRDHATELGDVLEDLETRVEDRTAELAAAVQRLEDTNAELIELDELKSQFISMVSHELRTPLTAIRGSLSLLVSGQLGDLPDKAAHLGDMAHSNTERLVRLVNDVLDLERMQSSSDDLVLSRCRDVRLIDDVIDLMQPLATTADVRLVGKPVDVAFRADPDRLAQTLANLVGNAIKFSEAATVVEVSTTVEAGELTFRVTDQGRGIPEDHLESVFGRFQQVDVSDSRAKGGTGLGLAICQEIVERHGGRIWVQSAVGEGSTFAFTIPTTLDDEHNRSPLSDGAEGPTDAGALTESSRATA